MGASTIYIFDNCTDTLITGSYVWLFNPWSSFKDNIKSVIIEDGVTSIGNNGFSNCTKLTSVTILSSVESISGSAFSDCLNLENITFEEESNLTIIGDSSFYGSSKLKSI